MGGWVDAVGVLFIAMARSLRFVPVLSFENTGAPVGMTRGCIMTLLFDAGSWMWEKQAVQVKKPVEKPLKIFPKTLDYRREKVV